MRKRQLDLLQAEPGFVATKTSRDEEFNLLAGFLLSTENRLREIYAQESVGVGVSVLRDRNVEKLVEVFKNSLNLMTVHQARIIAMRLQRYSFVDMKKIAGLRSPITVVANAKRRLTRKVVKLENGGLPQSQKQKRGSLLRRQEKNWQFISYRELCGRIQPRCLEKLIMKLEPRSRNIANQLYFPEKVRVDELPERWQDRRACVYRLICAHALESHLGGDIIPLIGEGNFKVLAYRLDGNFSGTGGLTRNFPKVKQWKNERSRFAAVRRCNVLAELPQSMIEKYLRKCFSESDPRYHLGQEYLVNGKSSKCLAGEQGVSLNVMMGRVQRIREKLLLFMVNNPEPEDLLLMQNLEQKLIASKAKLTTMGYFCDYETTVQQLYRLYGKDVIN